jgi:signal transduction histidine kinase
VVSQIFPLAGNEKAIGHRLLDDPQRTKEAFLARDTGRLTLAGPFKLVQGGVGIVGRLPVFMPAKTSGAPVFWGFAITMLRFPDILQPVGLHALKQLGFDYRLWKIHPDSGKVQVLAASLPDETALLDPISYQLQMPNGNWTLAVAPSIGWRDGQQLAINLLLAALVSVLLGWLVRQMAQLRAYQGDLERQVAQRTQQLTTEVSDRKAAQAAAEQNEQLLRCAIDTVDEAFVVYDAHDCLLLCNDKYRKLYASSSDLIVPGASFEHIIRQGALRGQYQAALGRVDDWVAARMAAHRLGQVPLVQELDDGRVLRVIERKMPDGQTVGFRTDITDLMQATKEAQAANLAKSQFLATMSHEIRTPMNGLLGMAQLLQMPGLDESARQDYVRTILTSGETLLALLNNILDLSKIEAGKLQLEVTEFSPESLLHDTCNLFMGAAAAKNLKLECQWHGPAAQRYRADAYRLQQMLANLVGNAIKFTRQGSVRIDATEMAHQGESVRLAFSVTDTGIGIAVDKLALLFKPFSQADSSNTREFGGSGLGLSIVKNLATAMGGDVTLTSQPGKGSTFELWVPAERITGAPRLDTAGQPLHETTPQTQLPTRARTDLKPVDLVAFAAHVAALTPLLAQNKFAALSQFRALQALVVDTSLADEINALAAVLQEMRFDVVLTRLQSITPVHAVQADKDQA